MELIPQEWIKDYIDQLLLGASKLPVGSFRDALLVRAEHAMDLVKAFQERSKWKRDW